MKVSPLNFSYETILEDFEYHNSNTEDTVDISGSASASVSASVPVYGSLGISSDTNSVDNVHYKLTGFGRVQKVISGAGV